MSQWNNFQQASICMWHINVCIVQKPHRCTDAAARRGRPHVTRALLIITTRASVKTVGGKSELLLYQFIFFGMTPYLDNFEAKFRDK